MSKKENKNNELEGKETVEFFQDLDQDALQTEKFIEKNSQKILTFFGVILVAIIGYFCYQQFIVKPKNEEALKGFLNAQENLNEGKDTLALGGKSAANPGFLGTAEEYSGTDIGGISSYNAGLIKFKQGKFQEAYDMLDKLSSDDKTLMAMKYGAMGDAMANLKKSEDAKDMYKKAISASDDPYTQYYFTKKAGVFALANNNKEEAKEYFTNIDTKYKEYDNGMSDAYIAMVQNF